MGVPSQPKEAIVEALMPESVRGVGAEAVEREKGGFRDAVFFGGASYCFRGFEGVYMGGVTESKNYYSISL